MKSTAHVITALTIERYAAEQVSRRLAHLVFELRKLTSTRKDSEARADAIHDIRVASRRLLQTLEAFAILFPDEEGTRVTRQLKQLLKLAGQARNCDIALDLVAGVGSPAVETLREGVRLLREERQRVLGELVRAWTREGFSARWREGLQLP